MTRKRKAAPQCRLTVESRPGRHWVTGAGGYSLTLRHIDRDRGHRLGPRLSWDHSSESLACACQRAAGACPARAMPGPSRLGLAKSESRSRSAHLGPGPPLPERALPASRVTVARTASRVAEGRLQARGLARFLPGPPHTTGIFKSAMPNRRWPSESGPGASARARGWRALGGTGSVSTPSHQEVYSGIQSTSRSA
jgi:hypothetical protein